MRTPPSSRAVIAALLANLAIAATKFVVALLSSSSAMLSEAIHSSVDTFNEVFLLVGGHLSRKPADENHPFGYGREVYFWSFIVAILIFTAGGTLSVYEGITPLMNQHAEIQHSWWNYAVLGVAAVSETLSFRIARTEFCKQTSGGPLWHSIRTSKDPTNFTVLFEDAAALSGLLIAFVGILAGHLLNSRIPDALASILIGVLLATVAALLARETKGLLIGEGAEPELMASLRAIVEDEPEVERIEDLLTLYLSPTDLLLAMDLRFCRDLDRLEVLISLQRIKRKVSERHPEIHRIFIEVNSGILPHDQMLHESRRPA